MWIGGSHAHGTSDLYSDVDLRLAVEPDAFPQWIDADLSRVFGTEEQAKITLDTSSSSVLHHALLSNGDLFDVFVQASPPSVVENIIVPIAYRDTAWPIAPVNETIENPYFKDKANSLEVSKATTSYWINTHKHRKVLHRNLDLMAHFGLNADRNFLRRIWYINLSGFDETGQQTIHSLTDRTRVLSEGVGQRANEILGMPIQTRAQLVAAIEAVRDEVSVVGRRVSEKLSFAYPEALEETVRRGWNDWLSST